MRSCHMVKENLKAVEWLDDERINLLGDDLDWRAYQFSSYKEVVFRGIRWRHFGNNNRLLPFVLALAEVHEGRTHPKNLIIQQFLTLKILSYSMPYFWDSNQNFQVYEKNFLQWKFGFANLSLPKYAIRKSETLRYVGNTSIFMPHLSDFIRLENYPANEATISTIQILEVGL